MNKILAVLVVLGFAGCKDLGDALQAPNNPAPVPKQISFSQDIAPIFLRYGCHGCHGGSGGLYVEPVANLLRGGDHGPAVIPGNPDSSLIMKKTSPAPPFGDRMPQGGPYLPDSVRNVIRDWIAQGAKDN